MRSLFRFIKKLILTAIILMPTAYGFAEKPADDSDTEHVTLALKWYHQFQFAGYYAAVEKGMYADEGLSVTLTTPSGNIYPVASVLNGSAQYGVSSADLIKTRIDGQPIVALAVIFQHSPIILMSKNDLNYRYLSDYIGTTIMSSSDDIYEIKAMFLKEGIDPGLLTFIPHAWSIDPLLKGEISASVDYITNEPYLVKQRGIVPRIIQPINYGIDFYADTLFTTENEIKNHPERVKAFRRASLSGWAYALDHPDEMIQLIMKMPGVRESGKTEEHLRYEATRITELVQPKLVELGHMNPARWEKMAQAYALFGVIPEQYSLEGFLYNPYDESTRYYRLIIIAGIIILSAGALTGLVLFWNYRLRIEVKKQTSKLEESEERLRMLVKYSSDSIVIIGIDGVQKFISQSSEKYTGYKIEELMRPFTEVIHPDDVPAVLEKWDECLQNPEQPIMVQYRHIHKTKGWVSFEAIAQSFISNPLINGVIVNVRDISDRQKYESDLKYALARNQALLDANPDMMFIFDASCRIIDYHPKYQIGNEALNSALYLEKTVEEIFSPEIAAMMHRKVRSVIDNNIMEYSSYESIINGEQQYFEARYVLCGSAEVLVIVRNITDRKKTEEEKERLQLQLIQSQKMESVGRLAGGVAHDFNNMLSVILSHAELGLMKTVQNDPMRPMLEAIQKAALRSADLTRQLLSFARKQTISPVIVDVNDAISSMIAMLKRLIGEDINLFWVPGKTVWPVKMDPSQIDQILANLCVNSRDAIENTGSIRIETGSITINNVPGSEIDFESGDYTVITVSDSGSGIDSELLDHIFEPFFTTKAVGKGTGLGLSMVYGIVKQNKGHIDVKSFKPEGTVFTIYLPRVLEFPAKKHPEPLQENIPAGRETILLVEDEDMIMAATSAILKEFGYNVLPAHTPQEALRIADEYPYKIDLLVTDVIMPEMNGRTLSEKFLAKFPGTKVLFMSGYTADAIAQHGVLDHDVHFIQKPFSLNDFLEKLRRTIE